MSDSLKSIWLEVLHSFGALRHEGHEAKFVAVLSMLLYLTLTLISYRSSLVPTELGLRIAHCESGLCVSWVMPGGQAWDKGARPGMIVISADGQDLNTLLSVTVPSMATREVTLLRPDGRVLDILVQQSLSSQSLMRFSLWTVGGMFILLGAAVLVRRPDLRAARLFWLFACAVSIAVAPIASGPGPIWALIISTLGLIGSGASFLSCMFALISDQSESRLSPIATLFGVVGFIVAAVYGLSVLFSPNLYELIRPVIVLYLSLSILTGVALLAVASTQSQGPARRHQVRIILLGTTVGTFPSMVSMISVAFGLDSIFPVHISILFMATIPASFAYAILQHQLLGIRRLVHRGMVYGLATFSLLVLVALALTLTPLRNEVVGSESQPVLVSAILVGGVLLFFVLRRSARWLVDNFIYRDVVDYWSALEVLRRDLPATDRLPEVVGLIARRLAQIVRVESVLLYLGREPAHCQLVAAAGERTQEILGQVHPQLETYIEGSKGRELAELHWESDSLLLVNLTASGRYLGYALLGPKGGGEIFREEEMRLVATITPMLALAIDKSELSEELRGVTQRLIKAEEAERGRIAGDLHDGPLQKAMVLAGGVSTTEDGQSNLARQLVLELREICSRLRPAILDDLGIVPALDWFVHGMSEQSGIKTILSLFNVSEEDRFPPEIELALFRVTQEATNNAIKHAKGTSVEVSLSREGDNLVLTVADDGIGFAASSYGKSGFGLTGMRERVVQVGGSFEINSVPELGTMIIARVPLG